jgi:hypothetical protein
MALKAEKKKDPAAVALGRKGGKKGGPARAAKLTPKQRSDSARKAVQARWAKGKAGSDHIVLKRNDMSTKPLGQLRKKINEAAPGVAVVDTSKKALHLCLKRIKDATDENEIRRLTEELQRIVFHRQYQNAEN